MEKGLRPEASPCARHIFSKRLNVADFVRKQTTMNSVREIAMLTVMRSEERRVGKECRL